MKKKLKKKYRRSVCDRCRDKATGERVRLLRERLGFNQTEFANHLGVKMARLSNIENGYALTAQMARLIKRRIRGVSLDWLWDGCAHNLSNELLEKLIPWGPDHRHAMEKQQ
jgi:transcriptional regulator with XRE-family HTH domain